MSDLQVITQNKMFCSNLHGINSFTGFC
jgi:hypothetical protein